MGGHGGKSEMSLWMQSQGCVNGQVENPGEFVVVKSGVSVWVDRVENQR